MPAGTPLHFSQVISIKAGMEALDRKVRRLIGGERRPERIDNRQRVLPLVAAVEIEDEGEQEVAFGDCKARSEERRVGKEGRSLCDWSSDVCSSDLCPLARRFISAK